jgi:Activator of Hsp90 ATPase homolog 1-like protein
VSPPASVRLSITVAVDPDTAFEVFTTEIDAWYQRGPQSFADPARAVGIRFDAFVGGRLVEVYDPETGDGREMGHIVIWEPGQRLLFVDNRETEVDVRFEPDGHGATRVTLEHRGLERLGPDEAVQHAKYGGQLLLKWFGTYVRTRPMAREDAP